MPRRLPNNIAEFIKNISNNTIGIDVDITRWDKTRGFRDLLRALKRNKCIKFLRLTGNVSVFTMLRLPEAKLLFNSVKYNKTLLVLDLTGKTIGNQGALLVAGMLERNRTLVSLDLSGNAIMGDGAIVLAGALRKNTTLTSLSLSGNYVNNDAAGEFGLTLSQTGSLTQLDLSQCSLTNNGATSLATSLAINRSLTELDVRGNNIKFAGAVALAEASLKNPVWSSLLLNGTGGLPLLQLQGLGINDYFTNGPGFELYAMPEPEITWVPMEPLVVPTFPAAGAAEGSSAAGGGVAISSDEGSEVSSEDDGDVGEGSPLLHLDGELPGEPEDTEEAPDLHLPRTARSGRRRRRSSFWRQPGYFGDRPPTAGEGPTVADEDLGDGDTPRVRTDFERAGGRALGAQEVQVAQARARRLSMYRQNEALQDGLYLGDNAEFTLAQDDSLLLADDSGVEGESVADDDDVKWIDLSDMGLGVEDMVVIGRCLQDNIVSTALDVSLNLIAGTDGKDFQGLRALGDALRFNTALEMLDLQESRLTVDGVSILSSGLAGNQNVTLLRFDKAELPVQILNGNQPEKVVEVLPPDLEDLPDPNRLEFDDAASVVRASVSASVWHPTFQRATGLPPRKTKIGLKDLKLVQLSEREARFIGDVLRSSRNTSLTSLDGFSLEGMEYASFHATPIQYHHLVMVGLQLAVTTNIKRLDLSFNKIGDRGATSLAEFLPDNASLRDLDLHNCGLTAEGIKAIGLGLQKQEIKTIRSVNLSWNDFREDAMPVIARVLGSLRMLFLKRRKQAVEAEEAAALVTKPQDMPGRFRFLYYTAKRMAKERKKAAQELTEWRNEMVELGEDPDLTMKDHLKEVAADAKAKMAPLVEGGKKLLAWGKSKFGSLVSSTMTQTRLKARMQAAKKKADAAVEVLEKTGGETNAAPEKTPGNRWAAMRKVVVSDTGVSKEAPPNSKPTLVDAGGGALALTTKPKRKPSSRAVPPMPHVPEVSPPGDGDGEGSDGGGAAASTSGVLESKADDGEAPDGGGAADTKSPEDKAARRKRLLGILRLAAWKVVRQLREERKRYGGGVWGGLLADLGVKSGMQAVNSATGVLQSLRLSGCHLDEDAFEHIDAAIVSLSWNPMNLQSVGFIMHGVDGATSLTALNLDGCDIDTNGALVLAPTIMKHPSLTNLSLQADPYKRPFVRIGPVGAVMIARALEHPRAKLTTLRLGDACMGLPGVRAFTKTLAMNSTLTTLDLSNSLLVPPVDYEAADFRALPKTEQFKKTMENARRLRGSFALDVLRIIVEDAGVPITGIDLQLWERVFAATSADAATEEVGNPVKAARGGDVVVDVEELEADMKATQRDTEAGVGAGAPSAKEGELRKAVGSAGAGQSAAGGSSLGGIAGGVSLTYDAGPDIVGGDKPTERVSHHTGPEPRHVATSEGEAQEVATRQIRDFLSSGLASFDSQAFRVTREEEIMMGIADLTLVNRPERIDSEDEDDGPTWDEQKEEERRQEALNAEQAKFGVVKASTKAGILQAAERGRRHVANVYDPGFDRGYVVMGEGEGPRGLPRADRPFGDAHPEGKEAWAALAIGPDGQNGLGDMFEGGQDVDPSHRVKGYRMGHNGASIMAQALIINTSLKSLSLRGHYIGDYGIEAIGRTLAENLKLKKSLTLLDVSRCNIAEPVSLQTLATSMVVPSMFKSLDVRDNPIRHKKRTVQEVLHLVKAGLAIDWTPQTSKKSKADE